MPRDADADATADATADAADAATGWWGPDILELIIAFAINGNRVMCGAAELARQYKEDKKYQGDVDQMIASMINWESTKNFSSGFITTYATGGVESILGSLWVAFAVQARLAAAIAVLYGYDLNDDRVLTAVLLTLAGDGAREVLSKCGVKVGKKITMKCIEKRIPGSILSKINKAVGFRLVTKDGVTSLITLTKFVPVVGGAVGGSIDAISCRAAGWCAKTAFQPEPDANPDLPATPEQLEGLSIKELKGIAATHGVDVALCVEKEDLVTALIAAGVPAPPSASAGAKEQNEATADKEANDPDTSTATPQ